MSAINESQSGDDLVIIGEFHASPEGQGFSWDDHRRFRIGERVRYAGYYRNEDSKDNAVCWMVRFDAADGRRYAATQTFFLTVDQWDALKRYFVRRLLREPKSKGKRLAQPPAPASNP